MSLACIRCGYNLSGLADDGCCPECSESIAESHRLSLHAAPPRFRRGLRIAAILALTSIPLIGVQFSMTFITWLRYAMAGGSFWSTSRVLLYGPWAIGLAVNLLWLIAIWLATTPTPAIDARAASRRLRRALRVLLVLLTLVVITTWAWASVAWVPRWLAMHAGFALYHILAPMHLLNLAKRIGRPDLKRRAGRACIVVPLLALPSTVIWPLEAVMNWEPPFRPGSGASMTVWWISKLGPDLMTFAATLLIYLLLHSIAKNIARGSGTTAPAESTAA